MRHRRLPFGGRPWTWAALLTAVVLLAAGAALGALWARSDDAPEHHVVRGSSTEEFDPGTEPALTEPAVTVPPDPEPPQAEVPPESVPEPESPIVDEPWPTYGYDVARSHVAPPSADHRPPYRRLWALRSGGNIELPPTVAYGRVYLAQGRGRFFSIDAESGDVVWEKQFSENCTAASPTVYEGLVFQPYLPAPCNYGSRDATGFLVAMDAASGKERWRFPVSSESTPLVVDGTVYVGSWDGRLYALNARTGKQRWAFDAGEELNSAAAYADGVVYIGSDGSQVFAVDAATGAERWRAAGFSRGQREYFYATPTVAYGRVFIGNTDGMVYAFGATSGKLLWAQSAGTYVYSAAAVWRQTVYVGSYDGNFYALDAATGDVRWTYDSPASIHGAPTVMGGLVYFSTCGTCGSNGSRFAEQGPRGTYALDARTGKLVWQFPDGHYSPIVADSERVYLVGSGPLYALTQCGRTGEPRCRR